MKKLLIDGDIPLYQSCLAAEDEIHWGDEIWTLETNLKTAKVIFNRKIKQYKELTGIDDHIIITSSRNNFRKQIVATDYKANRKDQRKPMGYGVMKDWMKENYEHDERDGLEADDLISWYATEYPGEYTIVSLDKDFKTVPGHFFRISPIGKHTLHVITPDEARKFLFTQILMGDATDGYYGIPGYGPAKAKKWLDKHGYTWDAVVKAYAENGFDESHALMEARCAKLLDCELYSDGQIRLWNPKEGLYGT